MRTAKASRHTGGVASQGCVGRLLEPQGWDFQVATVVDRIRIQPGWICLELGCDPANLLVTLSGRAGPTGFVVGVDSDPARLSVAREIVRQYRLRNVEILRREPYATRLPRGAFDFVYARLIGTSRERYTELLAEIIALTRPGGVAALQCLGWDASVKGGK